MDGNYDPYVDSVFTDETAAKRRAAALREGYSYSIELDMLAAEDYCYRVDYDSDDGWLKAALMDGGDVGGVECDKGWCIAYVRAKTHDEAERLGKAKIFGYLGKGEVTA